MPKGTVRYSVEKGDDIARSKRALNSIKADRGTFTGNLKIAKEHFVDDLSLRILSGWF